LNYAFSDDVGETWNSSDGSVLAKLGSKEERGVETTIKPSADGARVFEIPMNSGILNQEGQAVDWEGGFWALNREKVQGKQKWIAYYRDIAGKTLHSRCTHCTDS
jgi:BNR repeat-containing family member